MHRSKGSRQPRGVAPDLVSQLGGQVNQVLQREARALEQDCQS